MATRRSTGTRPEVVRCPYCGEDYSVTYKRCPFCDGKPAPESSFEDDPPAEGRRSGGKRLVSNTRGGGYGGGGWGPLRIVGTVVSLGLIVAAVWIVVSVVGALLNRDSSLAGHTAASLGRIRKNVAWSRAGDVGRGGLRFVPAGSTGTLTWSSSKPEVATVSDSGIVTAVAPGVTTITATMAGRYTERQIVLYA